MKTALIVVGSIVGSLGTLLLLKHVLPDAHRHIVTPKVG